MLAIVLLAAGGGVAYAVSTAGQSASLACSKGTTCTGSSTTSAGPPPSAVVDRSFNVTSTNPTPGATSVPANTLLTVAFSSALSSGETTPTLSPAVTGTWARHGRKELVFTPSRPFVPYTKYTLTVPGGLSGVASASGAHLRATRTVTFTIAAGSVVRLQQLLASLGYLPVSFPPSNTLGRDMATVQPGTFAWRWPSLPSELTSQWAPGAAGALTKGAVMAFETQNGLPVDGVAGPEVWTALLHDAASQKASTEDYTYVLVTKVLPQHLTAWVNGALAFKDIPVNTGVPGATTLDGTFQVFEHVPFSDMKGTNVTGSHYTDPHVPWASYFNGGVALHGFPRASYGWPQSNGCVEMRITTAGRLWPYTPLGTIVTVVGPTSQSSQSQSQPTSTPPPPSSTTTTTATTTTTTPPASTTSAPSG